jgi:hypothetical protein
MGNGIDSHVTVGRILERVDFVGRNVRNAEDPLSIGDH